MISVTRKSKMKKIKMKKIKSRDECSKTFQNGILRSKIGDSSHAFKLLMMHNKV